MKKTAISLEAVHTYTHGDLVKNKNYINKTVILCQF